MKCPTCGNNQRYRSGMVCGRCRYHFVLSPKQAPYCADRRFINAIDAASKSNTRDYTPLQLHATIFRRRNQGWWRRWFVASGTSDVDATLVAIDNWQRARREIGPVLDTPVLETTHTPEWYEPDIFSYGAEGVLVVDDRLLVDLLVARRVHMLAKVAIVDGLNGYPSAVARQVTSTIAARPDLPIFLLHSSRVDQPRRLDDTVRRAFGAEENPIVDLGLPVDVARLIPSMRWTRRMNEVPVEFLPNRWITAGVSTAIARRSSLVDLIRPPAEDDSSRTGDVLVPWGAHGGDSDGDGDGDGDFDADGDFG
jgi:hypothetical protein